MLSVEEIVETLDQMKNHPADLETWEKQQAAKIDFVVDEVRDELLNGRKNKAGGDAVGWVEENFYFGNAGWPSDQSWRRRGKRLQVRSELPIKSFKGDVEAEDVQQEIRNWLDNYEIQEPYIHWMAPYPEDSNGYLWLYGYKDLNQAESWKAYIQDRAAGMWSKGQSSVVELFDGLPYEENVQRLH